MFAQIDFSRENNHNTLSIKFYDPSYVRVMRGDSSDAVALFLDVYGQIRSAFGESFLSVSSSRTLVSAVSGLYNLLGIDIPDNVLDLDYTDDRAFMEIPAELQFDRAMATWISVYSSEQHPSLAGGMLHKLVMDVEL
jgi:hypothetical protein